MQDLSREAILRMVGLHDAAHMMRQMNAIQLSLEEEAGKMVTYWTEIRKTEKEVTLIAGRMDDAETDIAQLQVTAGQISASVSSLQTTVNGHTTSIGQLTITTNNLTASVSSISDTVSGHTTSIGQLQVTANSLTASVSSLNTTVSGHTTSIGQLTIKTDNISQSVSSLTTTVNGHTSQISTLRTDLNGISATVTADHTTIGTHTTQIGSLQVTTNSISGRVTAIEGDYVKEAEISLMVKKDGNGYISNASIKADRIDFTFTHSTNFISGGKTVMNIDTGGNLWIAGEYRGGTITQNITIGTATKKMVIEPTSTGARLVGRDGTTEVISVGFQNYGNVSPYVNINNGGSGSSYAYTQLDYNSIQWGSSNNYMFAIKYNNSGRIEIHGNWSSWYKDSELSSISKGDVYVDGNGFLKVKDY